MSTTKLYLSAPLEPVTAIEESLENKANDVSSFNIFANNIKEMITYFEDENKKSEKNYKKYKMLTTITKSFGTIVIIATSSTSVTLSVTGVGLIVTPIWTGVACGLTFSNKVKYEIVSVN